jgi:ABC-2 type transport system permease protein
MIGEGWYPIFLREMLLFRRKLLRVGYLFSAMVVPIIYLVTFGLGLGRSVQIEAPCFQPNPNYARVISIT